MKKLFYIFSIIFIFSFPKTVRAVVYDIEQLSFSGTENVYPDLNDNGEVVWSSYNGTSYNIFSNLRGQITNNGYFNRFPSINDLGEIVWETHVQNISGSSIYSNIRGLIIESLGGIWNEQPDINNQGEVIVSQTGPNLGIYSNVRGYISNSPFDDSSPTINDEGEVVWHKKVGPLTEVYSNVRGRITENDFFDYVWFGPSINDLGEIVWYGPDGNPSEIYSSIHGQITNDSYNDQAPTINNLGEIAWMTYDNSYRIYSSNNGFVTPPGLDARYPVINDLGQIAFQVGEDVYLATPRSQVIPEPSTLFLFGGGLFGLMFRRKLI